MLRLVDESSLYRHWAGSDTMAATMAPPTPSTFYGQLGILAIDGELAQCHLCGRWYGHLGSHVSRAHGTRPADYRAMFELNRSTGLIGPALAEKRRQGAASLVPYRQLSAEALAKRTREQMAAAARQPRRLEGRYRIKATENYLRAMEALARARAEGRVTDVHLKDPAIQAQLQAKARAALAARKARRLARRDG